jgi:hypothetical protein
MTLARRRMLLILGSAALLFGLLAAYAVWRRAAEGLPRYTPELVLPGFADAAGNAARIEMSGPGGTFAVIKESPTGWVLDRGNFSADFDEVRRTLISLAQLTTIAPKTARPDWLAHLSLGEPPKSGTLVTVKDAGGAVLARLITGNSVELGDPNGAQGLFVRHPGESRAWLARAVFPVRGDIGSWLGKQMQLIGPARLKSVTVTPATGLGFSLGRATPSDPVTLAGVPATAPVDFQLINEIGFAIATFAPTDVRMAAGMDFTGAAHVAAASFDGLIVNFEIVRRPDGIWARLNASGGPGTQAQDINARAAAFAFKLAEEKGRTLLVNRQRVLTPPVQRAREGVLPGSQAAATAP